MPNPFVELLAALVSPQTAPLESTLPVIKVDAPQAAPSAPQKPGAPEQGMAVLRGLIDRGVPPIGAAGLTGNLQQESNFDPLAIGDQGRARGISQVTRDRRIAFEQFAVANSKDPDDIETQLDFLVEELRTTEARAARGIFAAETPRDAAIASSRLFFRPGVPNLSNRIRFAEAFGGRLPLEPQEGPPLNKQPQRPPKRDKLPQEEVKAPPPTDLARRLPSVAQPSPPTGIPAPSPVIQFRQSVPEAWQKAIIEFLRTKDEKALEGIPKESLPVLLMLLGTAARRRR